MPAAAVTILVFGLFRPSAYEIEATRDRLWLQCSGERTPLEPGERRLIRGVCSVQGVAGDAWFTLRVPGRIERPFFGRLTTRAGPFLEAAVSMPLETAVASVVAAEMGDAPPEALRAQAIAARSYFAAQGLMAGTPVRHAGGWFCDTTHCQHLRAPPDASHPAQRAARSTAGTVLWYQGQPVAALYSAHCGGQTRSLAAPAPGRYPFFPAGCDACRRARSPAGRSHRLGLCQHGARELAAAGQRAEEILALYFARTLLGPMP